MRRDPQPSGGSRDPWDELDAILAQFDRIPDLADPVELLEWDEHGLQRNRHPEGLIAAPTPPAPADAASARPTA
jgi:hypothetical protein